MNAELKKLYDQKGSTWATMNDIARMMKDGKELTPEQNQQFERADADLLAITDKIKKLERALQIEAEVEAGQRQHQDGEGKNPAAAAGDFSWSQRNRIYKTGIVKGAESLTASERACFDAMERENAVFTKIMYGAELNEGERKIANDLAKRAQSTTNTAGGYTIPQGFIAKVESKLKYISPFFAEATMGLSSEAESIFDVVRTTTGNDLPFPTNDDTATVGELLGENTDAFANAADLTFGQITLKAYKYNSKPFKVSNELLNDSGVDMESLILDTLATRIARIANLHFTTGDNTAKPQGIVTGATAGKTTASATAITFPEILDLVHSVDPAYRSSPSARFMLHDNVLLYLKKLTIGSASNDSRPVWQPGYAVGAPDTIDGYRYLINQNMASSVATTNVTMLFGDMKKYYVRLVSNYIVKRLDERFADLDQTAWLMFMRLDGRYKNTSGINKLTQG